MNEATDDSRAPGRRRDPAHTRQKLLEATRTLLLSHGTQLSLEAIASAAGVSKGGLLHHFHGKEELFLALMRAAYENFAHAVATRRDAEPERPGRLVRAYLGVTFQNLREIDNPSEYATVLCLLTTVPQVADFAREQLAEWDSALFSDGLDADVVRLVTTAADGLAISALLGRVPARPDLDRMEQHLLSLIEAAASSESGAAASPS